MTAQEPRLAADKLTFLLSLVPYLIDHDTVSVAEVAERFGVSADRVRASVRLIAMSGIPGETSQYQHGDLFDIQWDEFEENDRIVLTHLVAIDDSPRFSAREAAALIAGLQYLSALPENSDRDAVASLMAKLTRGASAEPSQVAVSGGESPAALDLITSAVKNHQQIVFIYQNSRGAREERRVDPLRIESVDKDWYLRGWCHLREAVRTFRLDRMSDLRASHESMTPRAETIQLPDTLFEPSVNDLTVVLELPEAALSLIADYRPERLRKTGVADRVHVTVRVAHYHALKRLVSAGAGVLTVVEPADARRIVADWSAAGASQYLDS